MIPCSCYVLQSIVHFDLFFFLVSGNKTTLIASSKISLSPACVSAEHSLKHTAPIFFLIASPCCGVIGLCLRDLNLSTSAVLSRKSNLVPTRIFGTPGAWWLISGYHLSATLAKELGLTREKQIRKMSVSG